MTLLKTTLCLVLSFVVLGCGQKGDLYLPDAPVALIDSTDGTAPSTDPNDY